MKFRQVARYTRLLLATPLLLALAPGAAQAGDDEAEKIGLAAALGLTAADGKTTLGAQAGAIEAGLLETYAVNQAGAIIAALAQKSAPAGDILLMTRSEGLNAAAFTVVNSRITHLRTYVSGFTCTPPKPADPSKGFFGLDTTDGKKVVPSVGDIVPALATSTSFAAVTVSVEDRLMLASILLNAGARLADSQNVGATKGPARWLKATWATSATALPFVLPGEVQGNPQSSSVLSNYNELLRSADRLRPCGGDDRIKAAVQVVDAAVQGLNLVTDKAPVSPLILSIQQETLLRSGVPNILRVSVEQSGGTTAARSNIWYTLGFPGSSTVSAGLVVSFRLLKAEDGTTLRSGVVRCAVKPVSMRSIELFTRSSNELEAEAKRNGISPDRVTCSYITS